MSSVSVYPNDCVFVLTGSGISADSGLPTFRDDAKGYWSAEDFEDVCSPRAWDRDPWKVWEFYSNRRRLALGSQPNAAHAALAELERSLGDQFFLCTQNVDNLHEQAGSERVSHMHGDLFKSRCSVHDNYIVPDLSVYRDLSEVKRCPCGALLRPHVVFFDEEPLDMDTINGNLKKATLMIVIGTSGVVLPAAAFAHKVRRRARTVFIGLEEPANHRAFSRLILSPASEVTYEISQ